MELLMAETLGILLCFAVLMAAAEVIEAVEAVSVMMNITSQTIIHACQLTPRPVLGASRGHDLM